MTPAFALERARARKAELHEEQVASDLEAQLSYKKWLRRERELFERLQEVRAEHGHEAEETAGALRDWRECWRYMPSPRVWRS